MRIWLRLNVIFFIYLFALTTYSAQADLFSKAVKIKIGKSIGLTINKRDETTIKQQGPFGIGERKDVILRVFLPKAEKYNLFFKVPSSVITGTFTWNFNRKSKIQLIKIYYAPSISRAPKLVSSTITKVNPFLDRGIITFTSTFSIKKAGLYFLVINSQKYNTYERMPITLLIKSYKAPSSNLQSLMLDYFNILKKINLILRSKNPESRISSLEKERLAKFILELKKIKKTIPQLSEEEKLIFRKTIFNHPETRKFMAYIKRIYIGAKMRLQILKQFR